MIDYFEKGVDSLVDTIKQNPTGSLAATIFGAKLYGATIIAAAPIAVPIIAGGATLYGLCKLKKWTKNF